MLVNIRVMVLWGSDATHYSEIQGRWRRRQQPSPPKLGHVYYTTQHRSPEDTCILTIQLHFPTALPKIRISCGTTLQNTRNTLLSQIRAELFLSVIWFKPNNNCDNDATYCTSMSQIKLKTGATGYSTTLVATYQSTQRRIPEEIFRA